MSVIVEIPYKIDIEGSASIMGLSQRPDNVGYRPDRALPPVDNAGVARPARPEVPARPFNRGGAAPSSGDGGLPRNFARGAPGIFAALHLSFEEPCP